MFDENEEFQTIHKRRIVAYLKEHPKVKYETAAARTKEAAWIETVELVGSRSDGINEEMKKAAVRPPLKNTDKILNTKIFIKQKE